MWFNKKAKLPDGLVTLTHVAHIQYLRNLDESNGVTVMTSLQESYANHCDRYHDGRPCSEAKKALDEVAAERAYVRYKQFKKTSNSRWRPGSGPKL